MWLGTIRLPTLRLLALQLLTIRLPTLRLLALQLPTIQLLTLRLRMPQIQLLIFPSVMFPLRPWALNVVSLRSFLRMWRAIRLCPLMMKTLPLR